MDKEDKNQKPDNKLNLNFEKTSNIELEKILLGTLLHDKGVNFHETLKIKILPEDFYSEVHGEIFSAIEELYNANEPIDWFWLTEKLKKRKSLARVGGGDYIEDLYKMAATCYHIKNYSIILKELSSSRQLMVACAEAIKRCQDHSYSWKENLSLLEEDVFRIRDSNLYDETVPITTQKDKFLEDVDNKRNLNDKVQLSGVPSGFDDLDNLTGGFHKTDLIVIAGRPGMGKTALALNFALNAAIPQLRESQKDIPPAPVLIFNFEMYSNQIMQRLASQIGRINLMKLRSGRLNDVEVKKLENILTHFDDLLIFIDDASNVNLTPLEMKNRARTLQIQLEKNYNLPLGLIVVDFLQLVKQDSNDDKYITQGREITEISGQLKSMAMDLKVPVLCCSQIRRKNIAKPKLSDLREKSLVEDADIIGFVLRKALISQKPEDRQMAKFKIHKNKYGAKGVIKMKFLEECCCFIPSA